MTDPHVPTARPWWERVHDAFRSAGVTQVAYVPDAGLAALIELCRRDPSLRCIPLTREDEGIGVAAGAWLGGARCAVLMQSSGVGNLMNALGMARTCRFPLFLLVTMRGEEGETNPWQVPVGEAARDLLGHMGVRVVRAAEADAVAGLVQAALDGSFAQGRMEAVLVAQQVIGVKRFEEASQ